MSRGPEAAYREARPPRPRVGDAWTWMPSAFTASDVPGMLDSVSGKVIFVGARFFTVEAHIRGLTLRESFQFGAS